jgi:transcription elongation factor GreA
VDTSQLDTSSVRLLTKVTIKNTANNMEMTYSIVPEAEADLKAKKISVSSPIGKGLLTKKVGEIAEITVPNGIINFEIIKIEAA